MSRRQKHPLDDQRDRDLSLIKEIADRAVWIYAKAGIRIEPITVIMDLTACHFSAQRLRLQKLLDANDANFIHDVSGINQHLDRENYTLRDCFSPRYSA